MRRAHLIIAIAAAVASLAQCAPSPGSRQPVSFVLANATVLTLDADSRVVSPGSVAVDGRDIVAIGTPDEIRERFAPRETIDLNGHIVLPGLINTHTHAPMVLYRGLADDLALMDWLQKYIFPAEAKTVTPEFVRIGTRLAVLEMIRSGTTTYTDMYYFEEEIARVTRDAGLRGVLGQTIIQFPVPDAKTPAEGLARAEAFIEEFHEDELITPSVAPHSMYTLDEATLVASRDLAIRYGVPLQIHLAETEDEVRIARERYQTTPAAYLDRIGFWAPVSLGAHGVWVTPDEVRMLAARRVAVSHNPESNMKLASGVAPVLDYLAAGVPTGLGTDGAASNNDLDMFEAMRQAAFLHKLVSRDPEALSAATALRLATIGGAAALGMADRIGSLEPGKRADIIAVRTDQPRQVPMYDPVSHLVYVMRGDDVRLTMVNGRVLMRGGRVQTLDETEVIRGARAAADLVRKAVP